jgi:hypothetical protein
VKKLPGLPSQPYTKTVRRLPSKALFTRSEPAGSALTDYSKPSPVKEENPVPIVMQRLAKRP